MINLRYHIVSLVAVFLALGVGIIVGSTVIDQTLVERLQTQTDNLRDRQAQLRADNDALTKQLGYWEKFGHAVVPPLVEDKLAGNTATIVFQTGVDGRVVDEILEALAQAGVSKPARVELTSKWNPTDQAARRDLAAVIGLPADDAELFRSAGRVLGERLAGSADARSAADLLRRLGDAGFARLGDLPRGPGFPVPGSLMVLIPSGREDSRAVQTEMILPLVRAIAGRRPVVVGEGLGAAESLCERVRGDDIGNRVATVDHADTAPGQLSLVWALRTLIDRGEAVHYGVRRGANSVAPDVGS